MKASARQPVKDREGLWAAILERALDPIVLLDASGTVRMANLAALRLAGLTELPPDGVALDPFIHPDSRERVRRDIEHVLATGEDLKGEHRLLTSQGDLWMEALACRLEFDGETWLLVTCRDVTERQLAMQEGARLMRAIEQSAEITMITDADGAIEYVNPAFERVTGYSRAEALGRNPRFLKSGRHDEPFYRKMWQAISSGKVWMGHFFNRRKDGEIYEEDASISPVFDATGRIVNYVAVKRDVTHERQLEAQLQDAQRMESIGRLASGVAHEFKNSLQVIRGFADLLIEEAPAGSRLRADAEEIRLATDQASGIARQLLMFARSDAAVYHPLDMNALIGAQRDLLRPLIGEDIVLRLDLAADAWPACANEGQIKQVLTNLVLNARDALPRGGHLTISTANIVFAAEDIPPGSDLREGAFVCMAVADDGIGLSKEVRAHLFEPFYTTKALARGSGLGLSVTYGIVRQHGGWINVYSEVDCGSVFKVYLPALPTEEQLACWRAAQKTPTVRARVLLVEDEDSLRALAGRTMRQSGCDVEEAATMEEAWRLSCRDMDRFDAVVVDLILPDGNGAELVERMRGYRPKLPILVTTGYTDAESRYPALRSAQCRMLFKPYPVWTLVQALAEEIGCGPQ